jgi:hypothetical protein
MAAVDQSGKQFECKVMSATLALNKDNYENNSESRPKGFFTAKDIMIVSHTMADNAFSPPPKPKKKITPPPPPMKKKDPPPPPPPKVEPKPDPKPAGKCQKKSAPRTTSAEDA